MLERVRIKQVRDNAKMPARMSKGAGGYDLAVCDWFDGVTAMAWGSECRVDHRRNLLLIPLGWAFEIPVGYAGLLKSRSSWGGVFNVDLIDSDARGEIWAAAHLEGLKNRIIRTGERVVQLAFLRVEQPELVLSARLSRSRRGAGGFGSTGSVSKCSG